MSGFYVFVLAIFYTILYFINDIFIHQSEIIWKYESQIDYFCFKKLKKKNKQIFLFIRV